MTVVANNTKSTAKLNDFSNNQSIFVCVGSLLLILETADKVKKIPISLKAFSAAWQYSRLVEVSTLHFKERQLYLALENANQRLDWRGAHTPGPASPSASLFLYIRFQPYSGFTIIPFVLISPVFQCILLLPTPLRPQLPPVSVSHRPRGGVRSSCSTLSAFTRTQENRIPAMALSACACSTRTIPVVHVAGVTPQGTWVVSGRTRACGRRARHIS